MYLALKNFHLLTAVLSVVMTFVWSFVAWRESDSKQATLAGRAKASYVIHRVVAGLAGMTGLAITYLGSWYALLFPYVGLSAFVVHGMAATVSKRTFNSQPEATKRHAALLIQIAALLLSAYVMRAKPF